MPIFMSTGTRIGLILIAFSLLFSSSKQLYAAENTHPPVVVTTSGPTSGYVGETYTFSNEVTSTSTYSLTTVYIAYYDTAVGPSELFVIKSGTPGGSCASTTDCSLSGTFTPTEVGTYRILTSVNYNNGSGSESTCFSMPEVSSSTTCQDSGSEYITFTVRAASTAPVVESVTGPTSGVVGGSYVFNMSASSTTEHPILTDLLMTTTNQTSYVSGGSQFGYISPGTGTCTSTSCALSGTFSPTAAGTYIVFATVNFHLSESGDSACNTHPTSEYNCSDAAGKYITFVVTDGTTTTSDSLPSTGIHSNQAKGIYIGLGFIILGILTTQSSKILNYLGLSKEMLLTRKKSKFERKF